MIELKSNTKLSSALLTVENRLRLYYNTQCSGNSQPISVILFFVVTVNVRKFQTLIVLFLKANLVFRTGMHKMHVRIANREDPGQTASSEAV